MTTNDRRARWEETFRKFDAFAYPQLATIGMALADEEVRRMAAESAESGQITAARRQERERCARAIEERADTMTPQARNLHRYTASIIRAQADPADTAAEQAGDPECDGICMTGHEIGVPSPKVALAHPDCPKHT